MTEPVRGWVGAPWLLSCGRPALRCVTLGPHPRAPRPQVQRKTVDACRSYLALPHFNREVIFTKSHAAAGLCDWAVNIVKYYDVVTEVRGSGGPGAFRGFAGRGTAGEGCSGAWLALLLWGYGWGGLVRATTLLLAAIRSNRTTPCDPPNLGRAQAPRAGGGQRQAAGRQHHAGGRPAKGGAAAPTRPLAASPLRPGAHVVSRVRCDAIRPQVGATTHASTPIAQTRYIRDMPSCLRYKGLYPSPDPCTTHCLRRRWPS